MASIRQNYHEESEAAVNKQINLELSVSYTYMSMAFYFDQSSVAHPGAHKYFKKASDEEREHAMLLMKFQNQRGGTIVLQDVKKPENDSWGTMKEAVQSALTLEKYVNQSLLDVRAIANKHGDTQMGDFVEDNFLDEQVQAIKELGDYLTQLSRVGTGLGEFIFDHETLGK